MYVNQSSTYECKTLENIKNLTLAQWLPAQNLTEAFPISFEINQQGLAFSSLNCKPSTIELVVFSDFMLTDLLELQNDCAIAIHTLSAINHRNEKISYRFGITCEDIVYARTQLSTFILNHGCEAALVVSAPKLAQPGLLVMDMDSTTIEIECIDEIAKLSGVGEKVAAVTEQAMQGNLDFAESLHQRVATLSNSPESILESVKHNIPLMAGLETLITELKKHNWRIAIASGGFTYFADHLKQLLNLDAAFANTLEVVNGKLTGRVLGDVVDANVKAETLNLLAEKFNINYEQTVAMGDGANDLVMMAAANLGVAFHAKPIVIEQADSSINQQGLDCLLHWLA
ncbi:MAG: phosphoserine phosphatase SerB [Thalassotalea sp.]